MFNPVGMRSMIVLFLVTTWCAIIDRIVLWRSLIALLLVTFCWQHGAHNPAQPNTTGALTYRTTTQHSTAQHRTATLHNTTQHTTTRLDKTGHENEHSTTQQLTMPHNTRPHYNAPQRNTAQDNTTHARSVWFTFRGQPSRQLIFR